METRLTEKELYKLICVCSHYSYLVKEDLDELKNKLATIKSETKKCKSSNSYTN